MLVNVFDTSIATDNVGDEIIMDAVWAVVKSAMPDATFVTTPTHRYARPSEILAGRRADLSIIGGTNLLKPHMFYNANWKITPVDMLAWRNVVLLGVGWRHYSGFPDIATRIFLRSVLSSGYAQSVRDRYTAEKLDKLLPGVINTACPTMWGLDQAACAAIPTQRADHVVFTLTYYHPQPEQDKAFFDALKRAYKTVYYWPQQAGDIGYANEIGLSGFEWVEPSLKAYDDVLRRGNVDYLGTRLHGGIRAMQHGRRTAIIPVDNRATEIERDTGLPIVQRSDLAQIERWIERSEPTQLRLPWAEIERWKHQFAKPG